MTDGKRPPVASGGRRLARRWGGALVLLALAGCGSTSFVSTWKAPDAIPIDPTGSRVAAVVMVQSEPTRRAAEDRLAREISKRGAQGILMYRLVPNEAQTVY